MKLNIHKFAIVLLSLIVLASCRSEEFINEDLSGDSKIATLIQRTSLNDGSIDNIIDNANCFTIELPVQVIIEGEEITINSEDDFDTIEDIYDEFDDDIDELDFVFPIEIIFNDFTRMQVNNQSQFDDLADDCNDEDEYDEDIECLDFQYPITASSFNQTTEQTTSITITNDEELHDLIEDIEEGSISVTLNFPITVIFFDDTTRSISDLAELERTIEDVEDDCDEDDDYDYDDDDCFDCTEEGLSTILESCSDWKVDKLERDDNDLEDMYDDYLFNFASDGTLTVEFNSTTYSGTWSASGTGQNITVTIEITDLSDFNGSWNLHEIEEEVNESKVDLRMGDDRLRFESTCN